MPVCSMDKEKRLYRKTQHKRESLFYSIPKL